MIYKIYLLKVFLLFIYLFFGLLNSLYAKDLISGYYFSEPSTQKIQDDDFLNPGFIWVEHGKALWWNESAFDQHHIKPNANGHK